MMSPGTCHNRRTSEPDSVSFWRTKSAKLRERLITSVENFRSAAGRGKSFHHIVEKLLQLGVLGFGLFQDGDVGIGIFPEREEIFVSDESADASSIGIRTLPLSLKSSRLQGIGASHAQMRQSPRPAVPDDAAVVKNPRKLGGSRAALSGC